MKLGEANYISIHKKHINMLIYYIFKKYLQQF